VEPGLNTPELVAVTHLLPASCSACELQYLVCTDATCRLA